jgi:hypothetical protein
VSSPRCRGHDVKKMLSSADPQKACPKSDEGVRADVVPGALVVPLGHVIPIADAVRLALGQHALSGVEWEESKVRDLVVIVECNETNGDVCEAGQKFMREVRRSDGYPIYSEIIGRRVAVLGVGKLGRTSGAAKVEEVLLKRGGCSRLAKVGRANPGALSATWLSDVQAALTPCATSAQTPANEPSQRRAHQSTAMAEASQEQTTHQSSPAQTSAAPAAPPAPARSRRKPEAQPSAPQASSPSSVHDSVLMAVKIGIAAAVAVVLVASAGRLLSRGGTAAAAHGRAMGALTS